MAPKPHALRHRLPKKLPWLVCCAYCGLVPLKNDASRRELRKPCKGREGLTAEEDKLDDD